MNRLPIILASASPRRAELLQQIGWLPQVKPVDIDESVRANEPARDYCLRMATEKSTAAQQQNDSQLPLLTADTVVVAGDEILGKPADEEKAILTLNKLSGRTHQVYSAVCVYHQGKTASLLSANAVTMSPIKAHELAAYVASREPMDKAGAYGIQGMAAMWIESIQGSYSSIMGLPLFETTQLLRQLDISLPIDVK